MDNSLYNTQSVPDTSNPQSVGEPTDASSSSDFQQTAPQDVLKQEQQQTLSVQETGEPLPSGSTAAAVGDGLSLFWWGVLVFFAVVVGSILAIRFLDERDEEKVTEPASKAPKASASTAASRTSASAKAKKKPAKTKSGKPVKGHKKAPRKRR